LRRNDAVAYESPDDPAFEARGRDKCHAKILAALILNDLDLD
jgi:hypothetical protein